MTSNVGTQAFKAPEFFQRNADGKINYHRNVDIFAMGLTFLGVVQENPYLFPRIETPNEASELHIPAGLLMWERKTCGQEPLAVVKEEQCTNMTLWGQVRKVIGNMTCFEPRDRISAAEVVQEISAIIANASQSTSASECQGCSAAENDQDPQTFVPGPSRLGTAVPGPTVPGPTVPGPTVPGPTVPGPTVPGPTVPGPTVPGPTVPGPTVPGPTAPGPTAPGPSPAEPFLPTFSVAMLPVPILPPIHIPGPKIPGLHLSSPSPPTSPVLPPKVPRYSVPSFVVPSSRTKYSVAQVNAPGPKIPGLSVPRPGV